MKKIDLNFEIKNLDNVSIGNASQIIAGLLMSETKGDAVKYFDWAIALNKKESITVDASDFLKLKTLITETEKMSILVRVPIIRHLEKIK